MLCHVILNVFRHIFYFHFGEVNFEHNCTVQNELDRIRFENDVSKKALNELPHKGFDTSDHQ